jgi:FkbM family methyltransferase
MEMSTAIIRLLIRAGRAFQTTRLAKIRLGRETLLENAYRLVSRFLPSPEKIKTFWDDTMYIPRRCPFSLLILNASMDSEGSTRVFRQHVAFGMTVVDVGAHVGYYTLQGARLVGKTGRVYAFEPDPYNFALLTRNVEINDYRNVVCVRQAVSNRSGAGELFLSRYSVSHSMCSGVAKSDQKTSIMTTSLDDYFREAGWPPIDFIKMNIEGWEYFALKGMERLAGLSRHLNMMLEYHPEQLQESGVTAPLFFTQLSSMGFKVYLIDEHKGIQPMNEMTLRNGYWSNIFCRKG